ncbi:hypothetical protein ABID22_003817 [Pontibacter aydingkolensis]|uniref:DUF2634 domain-containing protein n=1 Tax=Pontibacter aydingkolensis TaxID=1911536 RepID=A0ABS7CZA4_9BACT|nr:hypothetical protein [Pontibacter aydingkolensis]MBW7469142.1 hypothetical protein [Pontibacter aydingkolensis]
MEINGKLKDEILLEGEVYEYKNHIATYQLTFRTEPKIFTRCCVLCAKKDLVTEVLSTLDRCEVPQYLDNLDLKVNVFDTTVVFDTSIHFLYSYTVEVELVSLNSAE